MMKTSNGILLIISSIPLTYLSNSTSPIQNSQDSLQAFKVGYKLMKMEERNTKS